MYLARAPAWIRLEAARWRTHTGTVVAHALASSYARTHARTHTNRRANYTHAVWIVLAPIDGCAICACRRGSVAVRGASGSIHPLAARALRMYRAAAAAAAATTATAVTVAVYRSGWRAVHATGAMAARGGGRGGRRDGAGRQEPPLPPPPSSSLPTGVTVRKDGTVQVELAVTPGARVDSIAVGSDGGLELRTTAPPRDGEANDAVVASVADFFGVPKRAVTLVAGAKARQKVVAIAGVTPAAVVAHIASAAAAAR